jgi:hypothetical protein
LRTVLRQAETIPQPEPVEHESQTEAPLDLTSGFATDFSDFDLDVVIGGFKAFEVGFSSRKKKKKEPAPQPTSSECGLVAPTPFPWKTLLVFVAVVAAIFTVSAMNAPVVAHKASTRHVVKQVSIVRSTGDSVVSGPTITATYIDHVLCSNGSPACGTGQDLYDDGVQAHIDPAFALAFFFHESSYGKAGMATATLSIGNMRCMDGYGTAYSNDGCYAAFTSWHQGYVAWYRLINGLYIHTWGLTTVAQIVPRYAPTADHNDEPAYIASVEASVALYRKEGGIK